MSQPADVSNVSESVSTDSVPHVVVAPTTGWASGGLRELWDFRELVYFLAWRDIKVRYKQTTLGAAWAILQPLLTMVVFTLFFGRFAGIPSDGIRYEAFAFAGLVPWTFFANGVALSSQSMVSSGNLIKKVYFPRLAIPLAAILAALVDLAIAFAVLFVFTIFYGIRPTLQLLWLPAALLLLVASTAGVGVFLTALNVKFRDVRYVVPFLVQLWMFATPVAYPSSIVPSQWRWLLVVNPMAAAIELFRAATLGTPLPSFDFIAPSVALSVGLGVFALFYFRRVERSFADVV